MSITSVLNSLWPPAVLVCIFFWWGWLVPLILVALLISFNSLMVDLFFDKDRSWWAFYLFILSEVVLFGSLVWSSSWYYGSEWGGISEPVEAPLVGCFLLLGSSISITGFHHVMYWPHSLYLILITVCLGFSFVALQLVEFSDSEAELWFSGFYSSCLSTVGLHFSHVLVGVIALFYLAVSRLSNQSFFISTILVWYWHFVDYVWLVVYTIIYVCFTCSLCG